MYSPKGGKGTGYGGTGGNGHSYGGKGGKSGKGKGFNGKGKGGKILGFGEEHDGTWDAGARGASTQQQGSDSWGASTSPVWPPGLGAGAAQPAWGNAATAQPPAPTPWMNHGASVDAWGSWGQPGQPQGNGGFHSLGPRQMSSLTIRVKPIEIRNSFQALSERDILDSDGQKATLDKSLGDIMKIKTR